jgi:vitamin B12 transporter
MNKNVIRLSVLVLLWSSFAYSQENNSTYNALKEVVVSDTKFAQSKEKSGKIIEVITAEDFEQRKGQNLANVLSQMVGLEINGNQSVGGKNLSYYIRGGRNRQVVIYIDGVPVTDASGISNEFDLRLLPAEQVEKIEIMKGAASTLYGSGAATGVINITLKKSSTEKVSASAYLNLGTQNTSETKKYSGQEANQGFSVNGSFAKVSYVTSINNTEINGISEAKGTNFEEDKFSRINVSQKIGVNLSDKLTFDFFGNYDKLATTFDNSYGGENYIADDSINNSTSEQFRLGFLSKYKYKKGEFQFNSNFTSIERNVFLYNSWTNAIDTYDYASRNVNIDAVNKYEFSNQLFMILGTQFQYFDMKQLDEYTNINRSNAKFNIVDPYATLVYNSNFGLNINAGARLNNHSIYGSQFVYNFNPNYTFKNFPLKLIASYSTAYITPSLYQLYSEYGNLDLKPEENATIEAGFEYSFLQKKLILNAVAFYRDETNAIGFYTNPDTFISNYSNITGTNNAKGIESSVSYKWNESITIAANYTFIQMEEALSRLIPKHKANINLNYQITNRTGFNISYQYVDDRKDSYFDAISYETKDVSLKSYQLINANIRYNLIKNRLNIFGAVSNIFNSTFEENIGFNTKGRNYKIGLNFMM